jgi:hypothetical protein
MNSDTAPPSTTQSSDPSETFSGPPQLRTGWIDSKTFDYDVNNSLEGERLRRAGERMARIQARG